MNEQVKELVAALRSGEYKQGRECLRKKDELCCLGVACEVYGKKHSIDIGSHQKGDGTYIYKYNDEVAFLPTAVKEYYGFRNNDGLYKFVDDLGLEKEETLVNLNDKGKTFDEIADVIEEHYNELFVE